ncbi:hypothetical protein Fot_14516 [Forsythia ovata]|uniref:Uncharacterized protein n=1 Tax=Forsythia ovata TaxID=205694 RepID=A0ABD1W934_9LAMI
MELDLNSVLNLVGYINRTSRGCSKVVDVRNKQNNGAEALVDLRVFNVLMNIAWVITLDAALAQSVKMRQEDLLEVKKAIDDARGQAWELSKNADTRILKNNTIIKELRGRKRPWLLTP